MSPRVPKESGIPTSSALRPITLLNCKIKWLCPENLVQFVVSSEQKGFMKGRCMDEHHRSVYVAPLCVRELVCPPPAALSAAQGPGTNSFTLLIVHQVFDASGHVFLFDITKMGAVAFDDRSGRPSLRTLLESPSVLKVIFDGRADADALWHLYGVYLSPVYCLQVCGASGLPSTTPEVQLTPQEARSCAAQVVVGQRGAGTHVLRVSCFRIPFVSVSLFCRGCTAAPGIIASKDARGACSLPSPSFTVPCSAVGLNGVL